MKLSAKALKILKNFSDIDPAIEIKAGSVISTLTKSSVFARAEVPDVFPQVFGIANVKTFLGLVSIFNEPEVTFHGDYMTIRQGHQTLRYGFCDLAGTPLSKAITTRPQRGTMLASFNLKAEDLKMINAAQSQIKSPEFSIYTEDGEIKIKTTNRRDISANEFSLTVGKSDNDFHYVYNAESISNALPNNYEVIVDKGSFTSLISDEVEYYFAGLANR